MRTFLFSKGSSRGAIDIVDTIIQRDQELREEMRSVSESSVAYAVASLNRLLLVEEAKREVKQHKEEEKKKVADGICPHCNVPYLYELNTSSNTCTSCGLHIFVIPNDLLGFKERSRYSRPSKHIYSAHEHFFQTLLDITCSGRRHTPMKVFNFCKKVLGRRPCISYQDVFDALKMGGYSKYYVCKYWIAGWLRGSFEVKLSNKEHELVRGHYRRYQKVFLRFQQQHNLGTVGKSGRRRLYWPVRFIMAQLFKKIGRSDLLTVVNGIASKERKVEFERYWKLLCVMVDHEQPVARSIDPMARMLRIPRPPKRVTYSREAAQVLAKEMQEQRERRRLSLTSLPSSSHKGNSMQI